MVWLLTGTNTVIRESEITCPTGTVGINGTDTALLAVNNIVRRSGGGIAYVNFNGTSINDTFTGTSGALFYGVTANRKRVHSLQAPTTVAFVATYTPTPTILDSPSIAC